MASSLLLKLKANASRLAIALLLVVADWILAARSPQWIHTQPATYAPRLYCALPSHNCPLRKAPPTSPLWQFAVPGYRPAQFGMVANGELYVSSYNGHVYQLDLKTGSLINDWLVTKDYNGCYSAPVKVDGALYVYDMRKKFYRLDTSTPLDSRCHGGSPKIHRRRSGSFLVNTVGVVPGRYR